MAVLAEDMVERYKDVFDARELWINVYRGLATRIGQIGICKKPPMDRYRRAVKDYVSVTGKVIAGLIYSKLRGDGRP